MQPMGQQGPQLTRQQQLQMIDFSIKMRQERVDLLTQLSDAEVEVCRLEGEARIGACQPLRERLQKTMILNEAETKRVSATVALREIDVQRLKNEIKILEENRKAVESGIILPGMEGVTM